MSRVARAVTCSAEVRKQLERLSASRTAEARVVERARIVLGCLAGERNDQIAARLHLQPVTVALWRNRFQIAPKNTRSRASRQTPIRG
jgi:FixJ family two-component response regulator